MTERAFTIYSVSFMLSGIAIYGSFFFTTLNDGLTFALISFLRSLLFLVVAVIILPLVFGIDGIRFSVVAAELAAAAMTLLFTPVQAIIMAVACCSVTLGRHKRINILKLKIRSPCGKSVSP